VHCITDTEINDFVRLLQHDKQPDYLDFLGVLCECQGQAVRPHTSLQRCLSDQSHFDRIPLASILVGGPLPDNQDKICELVLKKNRGAVVL
jgi:hypothetical protein